MVADAVGSTWKADGARSSYHVGMDHRAGAADRRKIAGKGMINHWNGEGDVYSKPDPAAVKLLAH